MTTQHLLDNPAWSALCTGNASLSKGTKTIKYYPTDISPFTGVEHHTAENLKTLCEITPASEEGFAIVTTSKTEIAKPWNLTLCIPVLQMVCENLIRRETSNAQIVDLSDDDIPQMLELTQLTHPGPFRQRTNALGHYQGIFDGPKLVAMAGQRMHPTPYAEISAVCTHPDYVGRGYAAQLMIKQADRIIEAGEIPFLHVASTNERAIRLYESMGYAARATLYVNFMSK